MVTFQEESLREVALEVQSLLREHWEEIALNKDVIKLDPDWEKYEQLAEGGILRILTARADGKLVGYYVSVVTPHLHYRGSLTAFGDIFYLKKEYREGLIGYRMLKANDKMLKGHGVQRILAMEKLHQPLGQLWKRLGYTHVENVYSKVI